MATLYSGCGCCAGFEFVFWARDVSNPRLSHSNRPGKEPAAYIYIYLYTMRIICIQSIIYAFSANGPTQPDFDHYAHILYGRRVPLQPCLDHGVEKISG